MEQFKLSGSLTIYQVNEVRDYLLGALEKEDEIRFSLSGLVKIDTIGYQLLLSAVRTADQNKKKFVILDWKPEMEKYVRRLGLERFLGLEKAKEENC